MAKSVDKPKDQRRRREAAKKAAVTRTRKVAGRRAAVTRKRRAAAVKARDTQRRRRATAGSDLDHTLGGSNVVAFLATSDSHRARTFYESILGLRLAGDEPFALVFDANGVMIRIQKVETVVPAPYTALGWQVADVASTIQRLAANGVVLERYPWLEQNDLGVWRSPSGARIAWFKDPDGNVLALTQW